MPGLLLRAELQPAGLLQRLEIVNADLALAADVQGDDDAAVADGGGNHMGAFGQEDGAVGDAAGTAIAGVVNAIADDTDHRGDGDRGGDGRYQHQEPHLRQCLGRISGYGIVGFFNFGFLGQMCHQASMSPRLSS